MATFKNEQRAKVDHFCETICSHKIILQSWVKFESQGQQNTSLLVKIDQFCLILQYVPNYVPNSNEP